MVRKIKVLCFVLIVMLIYSCKKQIKLPPPPSLKYRILTSHYWRLVNYWKDTSQIAKDNPLLLPLTTTYDNTSFADSCAYFRGEKFHNDGNLYFVEGKHCSCYYSPPCLIYYPLGANNTIKWHLSVDESKIYYGNYRYNILQLNDTIFSYYEFQTYNFTKKLVALHVYKSYTDW